MIAIMMLFPRFLNADFNIRAVNHYIAHIQHADAYAVKYVDYICGYIFKKNIYNI
jgi:hypothetical protein